MLTSESYVIALACYVLAALVALRVLASWLPASWPAAARWGVLGLLAGLLLTPALPSETATTLAPALVIVIFNTLFGAGWASAVPAVAQLLLATAGAAVLGVLSGLLLGRAAAEPEDAESRT